MKSIYPSLSALLLMLLVGCADPLEGATILPVDSLEPFRATNLKEWRDAWKVPVTDWPVLDLGPVPENAVLNLGLLRLAQNSETFTMRIYVGKKLVKEVPGAAPLTWQDLRLDLSEYSGSGESCRIDLAGVSGTWIGDTFVGPCELYSRSESQQPNVLIFLIDTLRMDHVSAYGYERETTPMLDRFAKDAIRFSHLVPQSSWTKPSIASLLTSTYPNIHGAQDGPDILRQDLPTLARALHKAGYKTHAFSTNINILPMWGFGNEFERFVDLDAHQWAELDDTEVVDRTIETIRNAGDRPWMIYAHAMGPHDPYTPPPPFDTRFVRNVYTGTEEEQAWQRALDQYDGEIAFTDQQFGRLIDALKELGLYEDTLIIVLSDHGEEFGERGGEHHGTTLHEEQLRIPLIVKFPGNLYAGEQRSALLEIVDIAPSILEIVEAAPEPRFQGASFMDIVNDATLDTRTGFASLRVFKYSMRSAMTSDLKYIHDLVAQEESWYNLATDPQELQPLDDPGTRGEALVRHVDRVANRGAHGLHLLMTFGTGGDYQIEGQIATTDVSDFTLNYYDWKSEVTRDGDTVRFTLHTRDPEDADHDRQAWRAEHAEQDHAHLIVDSPLDQPVAITLTVNGAPLGEGVAYVGAARTPTPLDGTSFRPIELLATPDDFDPAALPERFAVYVWYVPEGETRAIETLDEETIEALRGLGYLE
ncbi:MAG: sulfatase [Candidatus Hydrogenedentes bacterium]|nr:sulfatase [Candidatus Hydrogenedentota bacterium]